MIIKYGSESSGCTSESAATHAYGILVLGCHSHASWPVTGAMGVDEDFPVATLLNVMAMLVAGSEMLVKKLPQSNRRD